MLQRIHIAATPDRVQLAWARTGAGPVLVKAANWLTHLRYDLQSPVWRHWIEFLGGHFDFLRYDERGCGMSDRRGVALTPQAWLTDLETVIDAAGIDQPMTLLGISQGAAAVVQYAVKHPSRVARLILYGGYVEGWARRSPEQVAHYRAVLEMVRLGWGRDNPVFRQAFTSRFLPAGTHEQLDWFNALCRECVDPDMAAPLLEARSNVDISGWLGQVAVPTLVLHADGDEVVPVEEGRRLAAGIAGADFVELRSRNHVLLAHEPAWAEFKQAVLAFAGDRPTAAGEHAAALSRREQQVLDLLVTGLGNAAIGQRLFLSEKTVRNHLSNIYRKLGVATRAQAILKVRFPDGAG